jgi:hypothetical protein
MFRGLQQATGSKTIVDSSKTLAYGFMLSQLHQVDLFVLHLVRDARGAQYSLLKRKRQGDAGLRNYRPLGGSVKWLAVNLLTELVFKPLGPRYLRIRYEDFATEPAATLEQILAWLGQATLLPASLMADEIDLPVVHAVGGNPNRFTRGNTVIQPDHEWRNRLTRTQRIQIALGAGLGLIRYGYWPQGPRPGRATPRS